MPVPRAQQPPPRIQVERTEPLIDCGHCPPKRTVGEAVEVQADIFRDGHEILRAAVKHRAAGQRAWSEEPMRRIDPDGDRWAGCFETTALGPAHFAIEAWIDRFASWRDEVQRKVDAGQEDLSGELSEGAVLLEQACERIAGAEGKVVEHALGTLRDDAVPQEVKIDAALGQELARTVDRHPDRHDATIAGPFDLDVDRVRARFGAWYELFPRSFGGFKGVTHVLPKLADLGFDVVYLPPIHPIGKTNRKGPNNALEAGPQDPGSPWAIGSEEGGHDAVNPELGTIEDFDAMVAVARENDLEIALDFAIQCSADHPWLKEHPEWFYRRPDGTLKYAENPPKTYQDIYNVNFDSEDWKGLWQALLDVVLHWLDHGVKAFRVDNPHTKPLPFWEWLIREVRQRDPEVVFLSEAFTRPAMMRTLAKLGFNQSYTYFTWKNSRWELTDYVLELAYSGMQEYFRPNVFTNTPDILHAYLQHGGPPAFHARLVLAATLSPSYGIYSGYEHFENVPLHAGSEEYLDSEKYEIKKRTLDGPLLPVVGRLNAIRRENPALQELSNITFLDTANDALIGYAKRTGDNVIVTVVSIDPRHGQEGLLTMPASVGVPPAFEVHDLLRDERYDWRIGPNYVHLEPGGAHVLRVA